MAELIETDVKKLAHAQRQRGDFDGAARTLEQAIERAAAELADLYGVLGGTRKQQGDFIAAALAYDAGFDLESRYGVLSSYNALNRLVTRILLRPGSLADPGLLRQEEKLEYVDVVEELSKLQAQLERHLESERASDPWAIGDLAVTAALNGDLEAATNAVKRFAACSPPPFASSAYRRTFAELAQLETSSKANLENVAASLPAAGV